MHDSKRAKESMTKKGTKRKGTEENKIKSLTPQLLQLLTFHKEKIIV